MKHPNQSTFLTGSLSTKDDGAPDLKSVNEAIAAVATGFEEFKSSQEEAIAELQKKGSVDPLLQDRIDKIEASMDQSQKTVDDLAVALKRKSNKVLDADGNEVDQDAEAKTYAHSLTEGRVSDFDAERMEEYKAASMRFLREGKEELTQEERKALKSLSSGTDADGGYFVSPDMNGRAVGLIRETSPMRAYASVQQISGNALEGVYDQDEADCGWVSETGSRAETNTPAIGVWRIPVHEMYAAPKATQTLLDDAQTDIEGWLAAKVASKFGRTENTAFVNGSGADKPRGFLTYPDWTTAGTHQLGALEQFDTGVNGGFDTPANGGADVLFTTIYALKEGHRSNANWFMNRSTVSTVRKLKDSDNNYLWQPALVAGQPSTLAGYGIAGFEDMPNASTTGALAMAFGDMRATYQIVDRIGIRMLRDPFTSKPFVIFYSTKRTGGDVVDFDAMKLIKFAA